MPPPTTTPAIALESLLSEIKTKKAALASTSEEACKMDADDLEEVVRDYMANDAILTVAQAVVLASLNAAPTVQS